MNVVKKVTKKLTNYVQNANMVDVGKLAAGVLMAVGGVLVMLTTNPEDVHEIIEATPNVADNVSDVVEAAVEVAAEATDIVTETVTE